MQPDTSPMFESPVAATSIPETATRELNRENLPEELATTVDRIVTQLDVITRTLVLLEQRVSRFEDHVAMLSSNLPQKAATE